MSNAPGGSRPHFTLWLLLLAFCLLAGCAAPTASSQRLPAFTPALLAKGGSVCVLTNKKVHGVYADPKEIEEERISETFFRSQGFSIAPKLAGAKFAFVAMGKSESTTTTGKGKPSYMHGVKARLYLMGSNGLAEQELWNGTAVWVGSGSNPWGVKNRLLAAALKRFPN
jgi:hypothetical protein